MSARTAPPSGWPPPARARLGDAQVELEPLARTIADRYFERFPEDLERYGDAARAWELHDTQHLLHWAIGDVGGSIEMRHHVEWLARVLAARDFPLEHLAVNLELAAGIAGSALGPEVAQRLTDAAAVVRAH
jgi:hypothetical protein